MNVTKSYMLPQIELDDKYDIEVFNDGFKKTEDVINLIAINLIKQKDETWDEAIDRVLLASSDSNGGYILFPKNYEINVTKDTFIVPRNTTIDFNSSRLYKETGICEFALNGDNIDIFGGYLDRVQIQLGYGGNRNNIKIHHNNITRYQNGIHSYNNNGVLSNLYIEDNVITNQLPNGDVPNIWCGIGFHGENTIVNNCFIRRNYISKTEAFGIEFYAFGTTSYTNTIIENNVIEYTGINRPLSSSGFAGTGGIYSVDSKTNKVIIKNNIFRYINEVAIEGYYYMIENNYIEDTGYDGLNRYIGDNASIYGFTPFIKNNTIVNPGYNGFVHHYHETETNNYNIFGNNVYNNYLDWKANTAYSLNDLVNSGNIVYMCVQSGTSGSTAPSTKESNITDGTVKWTYKKQACVNAIKIQEPYSDKAYNNISNNLFTNFKQINGSTVQGNLIMSNNTVTKTSNTITDIVLNLGNAIRNKLNLLNNMNSNVLCNYYFDDWTTTNQKYFAIYNDNTSTSKVTGTKGTNALRVVNNNANGVLLGFPQYSMYGCNLLVTIRFRTNNGLYTRLETPQGWAYEDYIVDTSGAWVTKQIIVYCNANSNNKLMLSNKNNSTTGGTDYLEIDFVKIEEIYF